MTFTLRWPPTAPYMQFRALSLFVKFIGFYHISPTVFLFFYNFLSLSIIMVKKTRAKKTKPPKLEELKKQSCPRQQCLDEFVLLTSKEEGRNSALHSPQLTRRYEEQVSNFSLPPPQSPLVGRGRKTLDTSPPPAVPFLSADGGGGGGGKRGRKCGDKTVKGLESAVGSPPCSLPLLSCCSEEDSLPLPLLLSRAAEEVKGKKNEVNLLSVPPLLTTNSGCETNVVNLSPSESTNCGNGSKVETRTADMDNCGDNVDAARNEELYVNAAADNLELEHCLLMTKTVATLFQRTNTIKEMIGTLSAKLDLLHSQFLANKELTKTVEQGTKEQSAPPSSVQPPKQDSEECQCQLKPNNIVLLIADNDINWGKWRHKQIIIYSLSQLLRCNLYQVDLSSYTVLYSYWGWKKLLLRFHTPIIPGMLLKMGKWLQNSFDIQPRQFYENITPSPLLASTVSSPASQTKAHIGSDSQRHIPNAAQTESENLTKDDIRVRAHLLATIDAICTTNTTEIPSPVSPDIEKCKNFIDDFTRAKLKKSFLCLQPKDQTEALDKLNSLHSALLNISQVKQMQLSLAPPTENKQQHTSQEVQNVLLNGEDIQSHSLMGLATTSVPTEPTNFLRNDHLLDYAIENRTSFYKLLRDTDGGISICQEIENLEKG